MNKITALSMVAMAVLFTSGCVSTGKYKKLQADQQALTQEKDALALELAKAKEEKELLERKNQETQAQYQNVVGQLEQEVQSGQLKITQYKNMLTVDVAEQIFFDSGKSALKSSGKDVLKKVGDTLAKFEDKIIRVVGHTDNVPVRKGSAYASNWELSAQRATTVVRFLQEEAKIPPERLIAAGRGEYAPVAPNDTLEGRQKNRRIEIMLLDKGMADAIMKE